MEFISMLGFSADGSGLRPNDSKLKALGDYPTPRTEAELDSFIHMTMYLRKFIPGHAEHVRIMQTAIKKVPETILDEAKRRDNLENARRWRERKQRVEQDPDWKSLATGMLASGAPKAGTHMDGTPKSAGALMDGVPRAEAPSSGEPKTGMTVKRKTVSRAWAFNGTVRPISSSRPSKQLSSRMPIMEVIRSGHIICPVIHPSTPTGVFSSSWWERNPGQYFPLRNWWIR